MAAGPFITRGRWLLPVLLPLLLALSGPVLAESGNYRIEVLVFRHLDSTAEPRELDEIRSFIRFPTLDEPLVQEAPVRLDVMSSIMQDAERRFRLSATYRPLLFTSWEQSRIDYHPPVRLHDDDLIAKQLHFPHRVAFVDLQSMDMFEDYMSSYFRLDGTVQLVRSRFLHLHLDLEFRQDLLPRPIPPAEPETPIATGPEIVVSDIPVVDVQSEEDELVEELIDPSPGPALVHSLKQSRQIRTGEMQYFDTPYMGVLVRVTATTGE